MMETAEIIERNESFCSSCKKSVRNDTGNAAFDCPKCGAFPIIRCRNCREKAVRYTCPKCGFSGPN